MTKAKIIETLQTQRSDLETKSARYVLDYALSLLGVEPKKVSDYIYLDTCDVVIYHNDTAEVHSQLNADGSTPKLDVDEMWKKVMSGDLVRDHCLTDVANRCFADVDGPYICYKPAQLLKLQNL